MKIIEFKQKNTLNAATFRVFTISTSKRAEADRAVQLGGY